MVSETVDQSEAPVVAVEMEIEEPQPVVAEEEAPANGANGDSKAKREREEEGDEKEDKDEDAAAKKQKVDKSLEEERLDNLKEGDGSDEKKSGPVTVGPKTFKSSVDMYDYFFKFLHYWNPNFDVNQYEQMVLLDLIKKGHSDPEKKIGPGVKAFQIRYHPEYKSRCFFIIRSDNSVDDFSFRKCVDQILPLPENMKGNRDVNKVLGGGGGGRGGGGRGRGRGRGFSRR